MIRNPFRGVFSPTTSGLLVMGAILSLAAYPTSGACSAEDRCQGTRGEARDQAGTSTRR